MLLVVWAVVSTHAWSTTPQERYFTACEKGDGVEIRRAIALGASVAAKDSRGRTGLALAAQSGKFGAVQALLWSGASVSQRNATGSTAYEALPPPPDFEGGKMPKADFEKLMLATMLRCYQFLEAEGRSNWKITRPSLVLLNEPLIDYLSPPIRDFYWINSAEANGGAGKDDDGNGFVDDVYGWNEALGAPYTLNRRQVDLIQNYRPFLSRIFGLHNRAETGGEAEKRAMAALDHEFTNPDAELYGPSAGSDLDFLKRIIDLSHGSHVAGIVGKASHGKAQVHGLSWGQFGGSSAVLSRKETVLAMAKEASSMEQFLDRYTGEVRREQVARARTLSRFVQASGAGVVNMSLGANVESLLRQAEQICDLAEERAGLDWTSSEAGAQRKRAQFIWYFYVYHCLPWAIMFGENPNVLFIPAAGNSGVDNDAFPMAPAVLSLFFRNVLTVAAVDQKNEFADFSNYGVASVNLAAPGVQILSPTLAGVDLLMDGTSMAAPAVAGVAAEVRMLNPQLTAAQVRELLEFSGRSISALKDRVSSGNVLDSTQALAAAVGKPDWVSSASYFRRQGRLKEARREVDAGLSAQPTAPLWGQSGLIAMDAEDLRSARTAFSSGLRLAPRDTVCLDGRSRACYGLGDWAQAAADTEALLITKPDQIGYHERRAFAYLNLKDGARAVQAFSDFADVYKRQGKPPTEPVLLGWSVAYWLSGNVAEAQRLYRQVSSAFLAVEKLRRSGWTEPEVALVQQVSATFQTARVIPPPLVKPSPAPPVTTVPERELTAGQDSSLPIDPDNESIQDRTLMKQWITKQWSLGYKITSVGGYWGHWRVVMSKGSSLSGQSWVCNQPGSFAEGNVFPEKEIADYARAGKMITGLAGGATGWLLVLSQGSTLADQRFSVVGAFPVSFMGRFGSTHQITQVAGFGSSWVSVMSRGTPIDGLKQNYRGPTAFAFDWERTKWESGMRYTLVAGANGEPAQWVGVMGAYPKQASQKRFGPTEFPAEKIREAWKAGKRITSIAGYPKGWVVVMESDTGLGDQVVW